MSAAAFTPGPWVFGPFGYIWPAADVEFKDGKWCELSSSPRIISGEYTTNRTAENKANVLLMAASPEMFEVLRDAVASLEEFCADQHPDNVCCHTLRRAKEVLAKARGEA